jgi:regulator of protease activity HflC (stomatin/prohibitin superfamily)
MKIALTSVLGFILLFVLTGCVSTYHNLQPGHYGVIVIYGANGTKPTYENLTPGQGFWVNNYTSRFVDYPNAQQSLTMVRQASEGQVKQDDSISCHDQNGVPINMDMTITWRVDPEHVGDLYILRPEQPLVSDKGDGNDIQDTVVRRIARSVIPVSCGSQTYTDLYTGKGKLVFQKDTLDLLQKEASKEYILIDGDYPGEMYLQPTQQDAIGRTANAQSAVSVAELHNQQVSAEATAIVVKANADAESARIQAQGEADANEKISKSLTANVLADRSINKWDGRLPAVAGGESIPMISIPPDPTMTPLAQPTALPTAVPTKVPVVAATPTH